MRSLEDLIEEIRREARGEPPPLEEGERHGPRDEREPPPPPEPEPPVVPQPEPAIVEPRPPMPHEDDGEEAHDRARAHRPAVGAPSVTEADFDIRLDVELDVPDALEGPDSRVHPAPAEWEEVDAFWGDDSEVEPEPEPEPEPEGEPRRTAWVRRRRLTRGLRNVILLALAAGLGTAGGVLFKALDGTPGPRFDGSAFPAPPPGDQSVVAWSVWDGESSEGAFITVVAAGGGKAPVALAIPSYTIVNIPGYGTATVGDAIAVPENELGAAAVENLLGVRVDASASTSIQDLARIIDAVGGITVDERRVTGEEAVEYLMRGSDNVISAEFRFLRWQEVVGGILDAAKARPAAFRSLGPKVAGTLAAAATRGAETLEIPVVDIGSGLARPEADAMERIAAERFVPTAQTTRDVRLAVLNGVGTPGIGERVARVLIPAGFELVVSENAQSFDVRQTQIVATTEEFLPEARLARNLLGTGKVYIGTQPTGLVDVTVIVGADFGGS